MWSYPSLQLLLGPPLPGVVIRFRVSSMRQIVNHFYEELLRVAKAKNYQYFYEELLHVAKANNSQ